MALTPEESRAMAETIMGIQSGYGGGVATGRERAMEQAKEQKKLTRQEHLMKKMKELGMTASSATIGGVKMETSTAESRKKKQLELREAREARLKAEQQDARFNRLADTAEAEASGMSPADVDRRIKTLNIAMDTLALELPEGFTGELEKQRSGAPAKTAWWHTLGGITKRHGLSSEEIRKAEQYVELAEQQRGLLLGRDQTAPAQTPTAEPVTAAPETPERVLVISPDGVEGYVPANQIEEAERQGYIIKGR